jgi:hypothetical protein
MYIHAHAHPKSLPNQTSQPPSQPPSSHGLSTAAKGGIGGAVAGILLLVLGGAWVLFTRQKRRRSLHADVNNDLPEYQYQDAVKTQHAHAGMDSHAELAAGSEPREMGAGRPMSELPAGRVVHELPTY